MITLPFTLPYQGVINQATDWYNREYRFRPKVAQASLFFRDEAFGVGSSSSGLVDIPFDLLIDESHSIEFDIADHAVENGATISDHVQERLRSVQVTGLFTNHPIGARTGGYVSGKPAKDGSVDVNRAVDTVNIDGAQGHGNIALDTKLDALKKLARERKPVRLVTSLEVYEEMVIESLNYDRGPDDGESIKFTVKLRQVRTANVSYKNRDAVYNPPPPKSQDSEVGKKLAENDKDGKVTGAEQQATERIYESVKGEVIGEFDA